MKNQSVRHIFVIGSLLMCTIFSMSCQPNNIGLSPTDSPSKSSKLSSLSQEAKDAAIKNEQDSCKNLEWECKDFKVIWASPLEVTNADNANGTKEKWCIRVEYIYINGNNKEWRDARSCLQFLKKNGIWQTNGYLCECQQ
jgi:hypothetical protein